jgi:hypothetical protein
MKITFDAIVQPNPSDIKQMEALYARYLDEYVKKLDADGVMSVRVEAQARWHGKFHKQTWEVPPEYPEMELSDIEYDIREPKEVIKVDTINRFVYENWGFDRDKLDVSIMLESREAQTALEKVCREKEIVVEDANVYYRLEKNHISGISLTVSFKLIGDAIHLAAGLSSKMEEKIEQALYDNEGWFRD